MVLGKRIQMILIGTISMTITSSVALLLDRPTHATTSESFPFVLVLSPRRSNVVTSTIVPIYDQTPLNSINCSKPETLWHSKNFL
jgi:hypothetical protein